MTSNTLPDYYGRYVLDKDDAERLKAGTHVVTRIVEREDKRLQIVVSPVLCYRQNLAASNKRFLKHLSEVPLRTSVSQPDEGMSK